jgi:transposase
MVLRSVAQGLPVPQMAAIVRESAATVRRWLTRERAAGTEGCQEAPRPGRPAPRTDVYSAERWAAVRRRPRSFGLPFSWWTRPRWVDDVAERAGLRGSEETVRRALTRAGSGLSRPQPQSSRPDPA